MVDPQFINVFAGETVNDVTLLDNARMDVNSAGKANNVTVEEGNLNVSSGGYAGNVIVHSDSYITVYKDGVADSVTLIAGAVAGEFKQTGGSATIDKISGGAIAGNASGLKVEGYISAADGAVIKGFTQTNGGFAVKGGTVTNAKISGDTEMKVYAGATVSNVAVSSGAGLVTDNKATVNGITMKQGASVEDFTQVGTTEGYIQTLTSGKVTGKVENVDFEGTMSVGSGADLQDVSVRDGKMFVSNGAIGTGILVEEGGVAYIYSGTDVGGITAANGGNIQVGNGAVVEDVQLAQGGKIAGSMEQVAGMAQIDVVTKDGIAGEASGLNFKGIGYFTSGANAVNTVIAEEGIAVVSNKAVLNNTTIYGKAHVTANGNMTGVTLKDEAALAVTEGGSATGITQEAGGTVSLVLTSGDKSTLISGTNAVGSSFGLVNGVASNFIIYENGVAMIESGTSAVNIQLQKGAKATVALGANVTGYSVDMGYGFSVKGNVTSGLNTLSNFTLVVENGHSIDGQVLKNGGVQDVGYKGKVTNTHVSSGGKLLLDADATATGIKHSAGGMISLQVYNSARLQYVTGSNANGNFMLSGGTASNFIMSSGADMRLDSGASALVTQIENGGKLVVSSGAIALDVNQHSGGAIVAYVYGGDGQMVSGGDTPEQDIVDETTSGGSSIIDDILSGTTGETSGGSSTIVSGATIISGTNSYFEEDMLLQSGVASNFLLENGGELNVYSGGIADNTMVRDGGLLFVGNGAEATVIDTTSGGTIHVESKGIIGAGVNVAQGATLVLDRGAILYDDIHVAGTISCTGGNVNAMGATITLDVSGMEVSADYVFVENIGAVSSALFTIDVDANQTNGAYTLASNAYGFNCEVKLYNTEDVYYGTFNSQVKTIVYSGKEYVLSVGENGALILTVNKTTAADTDAPDAPAPTPSTQEPTTGTVTIYADFGEDAVEQQYSLDGSTWQTYDPATGVEVSSNGTVYFRGIDEDGNISEVAEYEVTNIIKTKPDAPKASANITDMTNGDVVVSAVFDSISVVKEYSFDGNSWIAYDNGVTMSDNGTVYFRAKDANGNYSEITSYEVANIDKIAPERPFDVTASTSGQTNEAVVVYASFSADSTFKQYSFDGEKWRNYTDSGVSVTANGTVFFRGVDAAGNVSEVTSFEVNNIITQPDAPGNITAEVKKYNVTYEWEKLELEKGQKAVYTLTVNGREYTTKSNKYKLSNQAVGTYEYQVKATITQEGMENVETMVSDVKTVTVKDVTDPKKGKILIGPINTNSVTVNLTGFSDNVGIVDYKVCVQIGDEEIQLSPDAGNPLAFTYNQTEIAGKFTFTAIAYDAAGLESKVAKKNVTIKDSANPTTVTNVKVVGEADEDLAVITWDESSDNVGVVKYEVCINGKKYTTKTNSISIKNLDAGKFNVEVVAIDKAKKRSVAGTCEVTVKDITDPKTTSVKAKVEDNDVTLTWKTPKDNVGVVRYELSYGVADGDSSLWKTEELLGNVNSFEIEGLDMGSYEYQMVAFDAAGNSSVKTGSFEIKTALASNSFAADDSPDLMAWQSDYSPETSCSAAIDSIVDVMNRQANTNAMLA